MTLMTSYVSSGRAPDWSLIPDYMIGGLRRYIERGIPPGHFLSAVLSNDLGEAVRRADDVNKRKLADYVLFLENYAPSVCWGSPTKLDAWIAQRGFDGADTIYRGYARPQEDDYE